jgi:hypothetical protein
MRKLEELNINKGGKPVQRPAPTNSIIAEFQQKYGVTLPEDYLRLLRHSNGGHPELDSYLPGGESEEEDEVETWAVNDFYFLNEDRTSDCSLWRAMEEWRSTLGPSKLPFACDGGGNQFFLDLSVQPSPVKVCIHDEDFYQLDLAPSFADFIDGLALNPDYI